MKKKWEPVQVLHGFSRIPTEEYRVLLEEFAELIYRDLCQLQKDQPLERVPDHSATQAVERTAS